MGPIQAQERIPASYELVVCESNEVLSERVTKLVNEGFCPSGSLVVRGCKIVQPMIRYESYVNVEIDE